MSHTLLNKREASQRARVSERTFDRVLASGDGPTVTRIGGRVLIREDHLDIWIERCAEPPIQKAASRGYVQRVAIGYPRLLPDTLST